MSDVEMGLPPYARFRHDAHFDDASPDDDRLNGETDDLPDDRPTSREGLPPGFRMRSEPHYVDAIISAPPAPSPAPAGAAAPPLLPIARELAGALADIEASARSIETRGRSLRERVSVELLKAEARRTAWLASAALVLTSEPALSVATVDLGTLLTRVVDALGFQHRLTGTTPSLYVPDTACRVRGDATLIEGAMGGLLVAVQALVEAHGSDPVPAVRISPAPEGALRLAEIAVRSISLPPAHLARFFDASWTEHPAGATGAVRLAAAGRIAELHGGRASVERLPAGGFKIAVAWPAAD